MFFASPFYMICSLLQLTREEVEEQEEEVLPQRLCTHPGCRAELDYAMVFCNVGHLQGDDSDDSDD